MKNILKKVLSVAAATALLMTSVISASAADPHKHSGGSSINDSPFNVKEDGYYTITLNYPTVEGKEPHKFNSNSHFGAYQIFSGQVKGDTYTDPGTLDDKSEDIPITDIKWGNAFGDVTTAPTAYYQSIVGFVIALAQAPNDATYGYAFKEFTGFDSKDADKAFIDTDGNLAARFVSGGATINAESTDFSKVDFDKLAVAVADVLVAEGHADNHEWLQAFTDILGGYAKGSAAGSYAQTGYVSRYYEGFLGKDPAPAAIPTESEYYTIYVPAGYYMIRDLSTIDEGKDDDQSKAFSARMLFVADNINQTLKVDVPRLDKEILRGNAAVGGTDVHETEVAGVGDVVHFQLKGTLPSNYDEYLGGYIYNFIDTLSNGLDLSNQGGVIATDGSKDNTYVTVNVKGLYKWDSVTGKWVWDTDKSSVLTEIPYEASRNADHLHSGVPHLQAADSKNYNVSYSGHTLKVEFPCLKEIVIVEGDNLYRLGYENDINSSEIYVDYYAKVNENAVVSPENTSGDNGNYNQAQIQYSNNPQSYKDTDYTVVDRATVYTFGLNITKVDAAEFLRNDGKTDATDVSLDNAQFALVRPIIESGVNKGWKIASFKEINADDVASMTPKPNLPTIFNNGYYSILSWEPIEYDGVAVSGEKFNADWLEDYSAPTYNITTKTVDGKKGQLLISGLDAGVTYTMVETATPTPADEYAKIDPFTITLTAATDATGEYTGKLSGATSDEDTTGAFSFDKPVDITDKFGADDDGSASMLVANFKYTDLPSTGGIGVYIYYIAGGCVVALALVLFALSKKKKTTK